MKLAPVLVAAVVCATLALSASSLAIVAPIPINDPVPGPVIATCAGAAAASACAFNLPVRFITTGTTLRFTSQTGCHTATSGFIGTIPVAGVNTEGAEATAQNAVQPTLGSTPANPNLNAFHVSFCQGQSEFVQFSAPGVYKYYCEPHALTGMQGVIVVHDA